MGIKHLPNIGSVLKRRKFESGQLHRNLFSPSMSTSTTGKIWCLLVGPTRAVVGSEFYVDIRDIDLVADLAALVKKARPRALDNYDPGNCVVL